MLLAERVSLPVPPIMVMLEAPEADRLSLPVPPNMVMEEPPEDAERVSLPVPPMKEATLLSLRGRQRIVAAAADHGDRGAAGGGEGVGAGAAEHGDGGAAGGGQRIGTCCRRSRRLAMETLVLSPVMVRTGCRCRCRRPW